MCANWLPAYLIRGDPRAAQSFRSRLVQGTGSTFSVHLGHSVRIKGSERKSVLSFKSEKCYAVERLRDSSPDGSAFGSGSRSTNLGPLL